MSVAHPPTDDQPIDPRVERTRAAIVEAAAELLLDDGPDAITHARVATAADVSRTTVYKHYPERSDLLFATAEAIGQPIPAGDEITGVLRPDLQAFLAHLASDLRDPRHARAMALMMERAMHDDAVAHVRDTFMAEICETFEAIVGTAITKGDLRASVDTRRGLAGLAGPLIFSRFLADHPIDADLVDGIIDDFISAHAPR